MPRWRSCLNSSSGHWRRTRGIEPVRVSDRESDVAMSWSIPKFSTKACVPSFKHVRQTSTADPQPVRQGGSSTPAGRLRPMCVGHAGRANCAIRHDCWRLGRARCRCCDESCTDLAPLSRECWYRPWKPCFGRSASLRAPTPLRADRNGGHWREPSRMGPSITLPEAR